MKRTRYSEEQIIGILTEHEAGAKCADAGNLDRRSLDSGQHATDLMQHDAVFAIGLAVKMLAKPAFRLGQTRSSGSFG